MIETQNFSSLLMRIARLENDNRRWKCGVVVCLVCLGALVVMGQAPPNRTIEAESFLLRGADGKAKAALKVTPYGPGLLIYDEKGKERAVMGVLDGTPGISLTDSNGKTRVSMSVASAGPGLSLLDSGGKQRVTLYIAATGTTGTPVLELNDAEEKPLWMAPLSTSAVTSSPSAIGDVCVESYPSDAQVSVDGQPVGQAPSALKLAEGDHIIEAKLAGYETWQERIHVLPGSNLVVKAYWNKPTFYPESCKQRQRQ